MKWKLGAALSVLLSMAGVANAGPTVRFEDGAFGDVGQNTNVLAGKQVFPAPLLIDYVEITQPGTATTFALQGNDLKVDLIIKPIGASEIIIRDAIINWRTTQNGNVTGFGIVPPPSITTPIVDAGNTILFTVLGATATDAGTNIFLDHPIRNEGQLTDLDPEISGNAATAKTLLADLNSLLAPPAGTPSLTVQKTVDDSVPGTLSYTITVTNTTTGTDPVSLTGIALNDLLTVSVANVPGAPVALDEGEPVATGTGSVDAAAGDGVWDVLAPGGSLTYTIDVLVSDYPGATSFSNLATATAAGSFFDQNLNGINDDNPVDLNTNTIADDPNPVGPGATVDSSTAGNSVPGAGNGSPTVTVLGAEEMTVTKTADTSGLQKPVQVGDVIDYLITVENTGAVTLTNVSVNDALTLDEVQLIDGGTDLYEDTDVLDPGETLAYVASHTVTQADLAAGLVNNTAVATAESPDSVFSVESSATGNATPGINNGTPTVVTFGLIDQIEDDLRDILEADLRQTIQMQAARFSRMAKSALDRLKEGQSAECGTVTPLDADGSASTEGGTLNANITVEGETVDCVTGVRRIVTADVTSSTIEGMGQQIAGAFSIQRERFADEDSVRGRFWGGYVSSNQISGRGEGSVLGFGLNVGIYGADRLSSSLYLDHYLAVAAGRHSFDLAFGARDPISATGDYTYLAGFGGLALSGSVTSGKMEIAPRLAIDVAYAAAGDVNVVARQLGRTEIGTIKLADYEGARATAEIIFSNLDDAADADGFEIEAAPRLFCDFSLGGGQADNCGFGGYLSLNAIGGAGLDYAALIDFESSEDRDALTFSVERSQEIANGSGAIVSTMGMSEQGELSIGQMLNLRF